MTDAAWGRLLTALGWSQSQLLDPANAAPLLTTVQYLVVPGSPQTLSALRGMTYLAGLPTSQGQPLMVDPEPTQTHMVATSRQVANIVTTGAPVASCSGDAVAFIVDQVGGMGGPRGRR